MIQLNMHDKRPIYVQIVDGIKEQIIKGTLKPGDKILSIRQLATLLSVTPNTVGKAYNELERQKILVSMLGKGNYINDTQVKPNEDKLDELDRKLYQMCIEWRVMGIGKADILQKIATIYDKIDAVQEETSPDEAGE